jgi:hypothetical protein
VDIIWMTATSRIDEIEKAVQALLGRPAPGRDPA